jgi:hypothetical protein
MVRCEERRLCRPRRIDLSPALRNDEFAASLDVRKLYPFVYERGAEANKLIRVVDESGEDYLYPAPVVPQVGGGKTRGLKFPPTGPGPCQAVGLKTSSDQSVVIRVTADPVPDHPVLLHKREHPRSEADASRIDIILAFQFLELKARMPGLLRNRR